jgi:hypothetical protein
MVRVGMRIQMKYGELEIAYLKVIIGCVTFQRSMERFHQGQILHTST